MLLTILCKNVDTSAGGWGQTRQQWAGWTNGLASLVYYSPQWQPPLGGSPSIACKPGRQDSLATISYSTIQPTPLQQLGGSEEPSLFLSRCNAFRSPLVNCLSCTVLYSKVNCQGRKSKTGRRESGLSQTENPKAPSGNFLNRECGL